MSVENVSTANGMTRQIEMGSATATSSDTETVIATIDARGFSIGTFTVKNNGAQSVIVNVYGYNDPAYSDEATAGTLINARTSAAVAASAVTVVPIGTIGTGTNGTPAHVIFAYYRVKLVNNTTAAGHASSTTVYWCLKNT